jgi:hypothetical protein
MHGLIQPWRSRLDDCMIGDGVKEWLSKLIQQMQILDRVDVLTHPMKSKCLEFKAKGDITRQLRIVLNIVLCE